VERKDEGDWGLNNGGKQIPIRKQQEPEEIFEEIGSSGARQDRRVGESLLAKEIRELVDEHNQETGWAQAGVTIQTRTSTL
jgi:hypothetical protein